MIHGLQFASSNSRWSIILIEQDPTSPLAWVSFFLRHPNIKGLNNSRRRLNPVVLAHSSELNILPNPSMFNTSLPDSISLCSSALRPIECITLFSRISMHQTWMSKSRSSRFWRTQSLRRLCFYYDIYKPNLSPPELTLAIYNYYVCVSSVDCILKCGLDERSSFVCATLWVSFHSLSSNTFVLAILAEYSRCMSCYARS